MTFKIGDIVRPTDMIPVSNKQNMFEDEEGTIVAITPHGNSFLITVKRNGDGAIFKAIDYLWEHI